MTVLVIPDILVTERFVKYLVVTRNAVRMRISRLQMMVMVSSPVSAGATLVTLVTALHVRPHVTIPVVMKMPIQT